jgi:hypothetical protein
MQADVDDRDFREAFARLSEWLGQQQCHVSTRGRIAPDESDLGGMFMLRGNGISVIWIYREGGQHKPGPAVDELITLTHESGHWRSWKLGERPEQGRYDAANDQCENWPSLMESDKQMIYDEELRAWRHGRDLLLERVGALSERFWARFDKSESDALEVYRRKLKLP